MDWINNGFLQTEVRDFCQFFSLAGDLQLKLFLRSPEAAWGAPFSCLSRGELKEKFANI